MRYSYTNTTQVPVALEFTMHDILTMIKIMGSVAADEGHDQQYQAGSIMRFLKDAHAKACDTIANDIA